MQTEIHSKLKPASFDEMWKMSQIWKKDEMTPQDIQYIFETLYPGADVIGLDSTGVLNLIASGLFENHLDDFQSFVEALYG